jgi:hypothetical protein
MLCDFYGNVLIPPMIVALNRNRGTGPALNEGRGTRG